MDTHIADLDAWLASLPPSDLEGEDGDETTMAGPIYLRRWLDTDGPSPGPGVAILSLTGEAAQWAPLAAGEAFDDSEEAAAAFTLDAVMFAAQPVPQESPAEAIAEFRRAAAVEVMVEAIIEAAR